MKAASNNIFSWLWLLPCALTETGSIHGERERKRAIKWNSWMHFFSNWFAIGWLPYFSIPAMKFQSGFYSKQRNYTTWHWKYTTLMASRKNIRYFSEVDCTKSISISFIVVSFLEGIITVLKKSVTSNPKSWRRTYTPLFWYLREYEETWHSRWTTVYKGIHARRTDAQSVYYIAKHSLALV